MITFLDVKEKLKEEDKCLDSQLWHACAGAMVQMPPLNSKVFYFPQGHAEHASGPVDFKKCRRFPLPPYIVCRVESVKYMADPETDEVYAKLRLLPLNGKEADYDDDNVVGGGTDGSEAQDKLASFAKTLTQSDANNGGGFSVPRYCAETIFPRLDFSADPPLQYIEAKDVHGESWKFKHIYRGTPRRHLLTTGWSPFVNKKRLVAGDSIVFLRGQDGDLYVGIRRAKKGNGRRFESSSVWNSEGENCPLPYEGLSAFLKGDDGKKLAINNGTGNGMIGTRGNVVAGGKVKAEAVIEAATLAANGQPFEVVYYPRASTPEFCVKASSVKTALQIRWCSGMRFKMAFETEDSSRISWFMGTISSVQVADPLFWPDSPWRLLEVTWDEPDLLQNVKRVSPWLVELVSNMPAIPPPFSPPRKKMRLPHHPDVPLNTQIYVPTFGSNLLGPMNNPFGYHLPETTPAGMQGARHAYYGLPLPDLHLSKLQSSPLYLTCFPPLGQASMQTRVCYNSPMQKHGVSENVSHLISNENSAHSLKEEDDNKAPHLVLFGKKILPEKKIPTSCSRDGFSQVLTRNSSLYGNAHNGANFSDGKRRESDQTNLDGGHC
ncbi:auxin response factor 18-like [Neltuma alba]|uniref:auxin response factor 18-like n=1 Tax=Neltuma alba TaxID=207710 RepID=UPI0010A4A961|nr:auxin response factor 18-like [Prosopis alba]